MASATAAARPVVSVYSAATGKASDATIPLPGVFTAPIRRDVVHFVHTNMAKNSRQAYSVNFGAGHQTSAESWGTGRAVARIPRVGGSGTHRSGQGAFGNMCRGGRMFAPTRTWRKWHRKINVNQRRYATASALAASAVPALVMARGHAIDEVDEIPLVVDGIESVAKTKDALAALAKFGADADVAKAADSKKLRVGKGKMRNRRYVMKRGPLVVYAGDDAAAKKAFRNLPGVELASVERLNLLQLAPGGHLGRFCVWTKEAFERLDALYGTYDAGATEKTDYSLPANVMTNADLARLINSSEVQGKVRTAKASSTHAVLKRNPLRNKQAMARLNPYYATMRAVEQRAQAAATKSRKARQAKNAKNRREASRAFFAGLKSDEFKAKA